jgi:hypothetical protein
MRPYSDLRDQMIRKHFALGGQVSLLAFCY